MPPSHILGAIKPLQQEPKPDPSPPFSSFGMARKASLQLQEAAFLTPS